MDGRGHRAYFRHPAQELRWDSAEKKLVIELSQSDVNGCNSARLLLQAAVK